MPDLHSEIDTDDVVQTVHTKLASESVAVMSRGRKHVFRVRSVFCSRKNKFVLITLKPAHVLWYELVNDSATSA